jgi:hypothetical protein
VIGIGQITYVAVSGAHHPCNICPILSRPRKEWVLAQPSQLSIMSSHHPSYPLHNGLKTYMTPKASWIRLGNLPVSRCQALLTSASIVCTQYLIKSLGEKYGINIFDFNYPIPGSRQFWASNAPHSTAFKPNWSERAPTADT